MPEIFYAFIDPKEEYQIDITRLPWDARAAESLISTALLLLAIFSLHWVRARVSFWAAACLFVTLIVPAVVIGPLVHSESQWPIVEINVVLVSCYMCFVIISGYVEITFVRFWGAVVGGHVEGEGTVKSSQGHVLDWALLAALLLVLLAVVMTLGFNVNLNEGLEDIYVVRLQMRDADLGFLAYAGNWAIVVTPSLLYGMLAKNRSRLMLAVALAMAIETLMLVSTSTKVGIWHALIPLSYFVLQPLDHRTRVLAIVGALVAIVLVFPTIGELFPSVSTVFQGVPRRVFYATGFLHGFALEMFSEFPAFGFQDLLSYFTGDVVETRYTYIFGAFVGTGYDSNANVNFLADGYINGRYAGMIGVTIVAATTVGIFAGLSIVSRSLIGVLFLIAMGQAYAESAVQQVYLTGGVLIMMLFLAGRALLMSRVQEHEEVPLANSSVLR